MPARTLQKHPPMDEREACRAALYKAQRVLSKLRTPGAVAARGGADITAPYFRDVAEEGLRELNATIARLGWVRGVPAPVGGAGVRQEITAAEARDLRALLDRFEGCDETVYTPTIDMLRAALAAAVGEGVEPDGV